MKAFDEVFDLRLVDIVVLYKLVFCDNQLKAVIYITVFLIRLMRQSCVSHDNQEVIAYLLSRSISE